MCVPDVVNNLNVTAFNLMSRPNKTRHIEWYETCKCKCRLDASVCNNKQCWNDDKCKCECKELVDKGICDKGFICKPSNCECEYNKLCDIGEYLDYENCKYRKKLVDKLVQECTQNVEEVKLAKITSAEDEYMQKCSSCRLYIVFEWFLQLTLELALILVFVSMLLMKKIFLEQQFIELNYK